MFLDLWKCVFLKIQTKIYNKVFRIIDHYEKSFLPLKHQKSIFSRILSETFALTFSPNTLSLSKSIKVNSDAVCIDFVSFMQHSEMSSHIRIFKDVSTICFSCFRRLVLQPRSPQVSQWRIIDKSSLSVSNTSWSCNKSLYNTLLFCPNRYSVETNDVRTAFWRWKIQMYTFL